MRKQWRVLVLCVGLGACGGDDDVARGGAVSGGEPGVASGSDDQSGDAGFGAESLDGSGVVSIGGGSYEFDVEYCEGAEGSLVRIAGPGTTPDGEPFWVEVRWGLGGPVTTQLGVGVVEPSAGSEGDPHWSNRLEDGVEHVSFDDGFAISYEAPFRRAGLPSGPEVPGTVDASCTPA